MSRLGWRQGIDLPEQVRPKIGRQPRLGTFIYLDTRSLTLRERVRLAVSVLLTPLTIILLGRSIKVNYVPSRLRPIGDD